MEGGIKYTKQLPRPSKNILVWEFTKLCIRTYERGKAPCIYKIFCLGGSSCEVSENITTVWIIGGGGVKRGSCSAMDPLPPPPGEDPGIDVGGGGGRSVLERGLIEESLKAKKCQKDIILELFSPDRPS